MAQELVQMNIDVSKLKVSKFNAREQDDEGEGFEELVQSIELNGLVHPIEVTLSKNGQYEVVAGSRRLRAFKKLGLKQIPATVKELDETDSRIDSLVENIHRIGLTDEEKKESLRAIYKQWNDKQIVQYVRRLVRDNTTDSPESRQSERGGSEQKIFVPEEFEILCRRVGYAPSTQYGFFFTEGIREEMVESEKLPDDVKKYAKQRINTIDVGTKKSRKKAQKIVQQIVHDVRTGALKKDEDTGEYINIPSKREKIDEIEVVPSPRRTREEIIDLSKDLYELVTTVKLNMNDIDRAEQQATSTQAVNRMKELATNGLGQRELTALQTAVIPLAKALDRFTDILEDE